MVTRILLVTFLLTITKTINCQYNSSANVYEFRAGVIMVDKSVLPFKNEMVGPAIDMAIEKCAQQFGIQFIKYVALHPDWCDSVFTAGAIADLKYKHNISVVIGPGCSSDLTICAKTATYYNLPQVTGVGDLVLGKENYPTLTRLSYSLEKQSGFITSVLEKFKWKHIAIIYDTYDVLMRIQGSSLVNHLRSDTNYPRPYDIPFQSNKPRDLNAFSREAGDHARVIIFLGSGGDLRNFMLYAHAQGKTSGDYVFITIELFRSEAWGDFSWRRGDASDAAAKEAYQSLIIFTLTQPQGPHWDNFSKEVIFRAKRDYKFDYGNEEVNYFVGAYYNSVIYLARALNATIADGEDPYNGVKVAQKLWNSTFPGIFGDVFIDELGDRIADYSLLDMTNLKDGTFEVVAMYSGAGNHLTVLTDNPIHWPSGGPPVDVPRCGFKGDSPVCVIEKPTSYTLVIVTGSLIGVMLVTIIVGVIIFRKLKFESQLASNRWKIKMVDVIGSKGGQNAFSSRISMASSAKSRPGMFSKDSSIDGNEHQLFTRVGTYNGTLVAIRKIHASKIDINRKLLLEVKKVCDCQHDNLVRFVGACVEPNNLAIFTEYCPKGSLEDILANDAIKLDWLFKYSLMTDIAKGINYIHTNAINVHGHLSSSNCVVDNRFVLKLTDFGLPTFYDNDKKYDGESHSYYRAKFWRAPELIRFPTFHTQSGDIYSFGIILQEIVTRNEPYETFDLEPKEIIQRVLNGGKPAFRPQVDKSSCSPELNSLMEQCWAEEPVLRPKIGDIMKELKVITRDSGLSGNILDNLLSRMEQYAENLESLVENRTQAFLDEKRKSEELLYRVLPKSVANQLKKGQSVQPENYENVTVYFSDVVGFTALSAESSPMQVVDLLNDLYTCFDAVIDSYDVYKVETIGDAYMCVSGLPLKNGNQHVVEISCMALALLKATETFKIRHRPNYQLKVRIGLHSGPVVAGVVGLTMPRYCLFGDTVNTASRMESMGEATKIHISPTTKELLDTFGFFKTTSRGEIPVKGKGIMTTYWLDGQVPMSERNVKSRMELIDL